METEPNVRMPIAIMVVLITDTPGSMKRDTGQPPAQCMTWKQVATKTGTPMSI